MLALTFRCLGWLCNQLCGVAAERRAASRATRRVGHVQNASLENSGLKVWEADLAPADEFGRIFSDVAGEILIQSLPGSVKVRNFRHPGKVFITNTRLCFYSYVLGVEVSFAAKWIEIASLRLEENSESHTYPVVVSLKEAMDFDGKDVKMLDLRVFEFSDLGIFQKSAMYFVGADLFGIYEESEVKSPEKSPMEKSVKEVPTSTRLVRTASMISPDEVLKELSMWELERRTNLFKSHWKAPYWPHDGAAKMKWVALEGNAYIRHPFIPVSMAEEKIAVSDIPPVESVEFLGMRRNCTWSTCPVDGETDELGWQYSTDFVMGNTGWLPYCGSVSFVRRRCWQPCFYTDADDDAAPATAKETIFEQVLGEISLELLGQSLESDDWKDPDSLMAFYWEETGAMDLDISPWSDGSSFASAVKGKVRTIEMRSPVPPAPMCPKETRVQSTWHIVVLPDQVLLESVTMSLDVPCGTMFNVISCDSFTIKDGKLKMSRTCGVEWLQSSWLKSMVEQNVPPQLKAIAERMVGVVTRWWEKALPELT
ncbi:Acylcarnitine hydrolase [Durusdinium trenchii]|uniref:Acylcarnitine hydrolase n=1 Tax=Durusdinium trenchii TaxID=1381693 RepID=A0ABP0NEA7_9DINO